MSVQAAGRSCARPSWLVLWTSLLLVACGPTIKDAGPPVRHVRFAEDREVASAESPHLIPLVTHQLVPQGAEGVRRFDAFEDWAWFVEANAFGQAALREPPAGLEPSVLDVLPDGLRIPRGLGVAAWFDLEGPGSLWIEAAGVGADGGLSLSVIPLDQPSESLGALVAPGRLRALRATNVIGRPKTVEVNTVEPEEAVQVVRSDGSSGPADASALLHFTPAPGTRSLLVLVVPTEGPADLRDVFVARPPPLETLARERLVSEQGVGDINLAGLSRPSLVLTPGATTTSHWLGVTRGVELDLAYGLLGTPPADGELVVSLISIDDERRSAGVRLPLAELGASWRPRRLSLEELGWDGESPQRFVFEFRGSDGDPTPVLAVGAPRLLVPPREERPNLVIVSLDTLRADRLGVAGNTRGLSPRLDELAARGTTFLSAYANAPYTLPSHTTLFSGLLPPTHGVETYRDRIPSAAPWLPAALAERGYDTAAFTAGGYVAASFGFGRGFDLYCEIDPLGDQYTPGYARHSWSFPDGRVGALGEALDWLATREGRPGFLFLHTYFAHEYLPPPDLAERFGLVGEGEPPLSFEAKERFGGLHVAEHGLAPDDERRLVDAYDATVLGVDRMVGALLDTLQQAGLTEDTIVVVTSDHGEELLEHGGTGHGLTLHEEVLRVPLIVRVPGRAEGARVRKRVALVDLAPTLRELLGLQLSPALDGESFATVFDGGALREREIFARVADRPRSERSALLANDWKLIRAEGGDEFLVQPAAPEQLFQLSADSAERDDRLASEPVKAAALRERLSDLVHSATSAGEALRAASGETSGELSPEMESRLRALGYLGDG